MTNQGPRDRAHPPDGLWRAYIDGEISPARRLRLRAHLARCERCRAHLEQVRAAGDATSRLLRRVAPRTDTADALARLNVLTGRVRRRPPFSPVSAFIAGGVAAASLAASVLLLHPGPTRALERFHGVDEFASVLDECCAEQPGDTPAREGVLTLQLVSGSPLKVHYMDVDGSGTLSTGDIVRQVRTTRRR